MSLKGPMAWPHLQSLCDGYLHQDFTAEYGSAVDAVQAWLADAGPDDALAVSSEWRSFLNITHGMDVGARSAALRDVAGGAWAPASDHEFALVSARLMNAGEQFRIQNEE